MPCTLSSQLCSLSTLSLLSLLCCRQSQLSSLQEAHANQLSSQQEASARQLAQQLKTADAIIKELEGAAVSLQNQLAAEVDRADGYSRELQRCVPCAVVVPKACAMGTAIECLPQSGLRSLHCDWCWSSFALRH
jgi:hypothetical protein